ncbi:MAG: VPLPA-CTERM sorting domain-containing protein, partial [Pseudomonadota bacterium]
DFIEVSDNGPLPETGEYDPTGLADIRIGQVAHIDDANAYAYFPLNTDISGLSGDIVFNAERFGNGWNETLFYAVAQHELGHSLGMGHFVNDGAPQQNSAFEFYGNYNGPVFPLDPLAVQALQGAYGSGIGSVTPLTAVPLPAASLLIGSAIIALSAFSRRRREPTGGRSQPDFDCRPA